MPESSLLPHLKSLLQITVLQRFQRRGAPAKPNLMQQGNSANNMWSNGQLRVKQTRISWKAQFSVRTVPSGSPFKTIILKQQTMEFITYPRYQSPHRSKALFLPRLQIWNAAVVHLRGYTRGKFHHQIPALSGSDSDSDTDVPLTQNSSCKRRNLVSPETLNVASAGCDTEQINTHGRLSPLS